MDDQTLETTRNISIEDIKDRDVLRLTYTEEWKASHYDRDWQHCFDGLAVVFKANAGNLFMRETYWGYDPTTFLLEEANERFHITLLFNFHDVEKLDEHHVSDYASKDVHRLPMHHGHRTTFYVKKGATRLNREDSK
ncbi:hypothetical protein DRO66_00250 [Candidatus Bathyarchaeota archaeon]|nr:MAG: hypothetical protein DRO66_00250 [Candidatus Bathyarchaeota archaeon]